MRFMSDFREAMWGVVQQGISGSTSTSSRTPTSTSPGWNGTHQAFLSALEALA